MKVLRERLALCCLVCVALLGCDDGGGELTAKFAASFAPGPHTVSVLGVYQDGRMSLGSWDDLAPYLVPALRSDHCPVGYDALATSGAPLAEAIDKFAREDGPTDELLTRLAPAAEGDLMLVLTFAGKLPTKPRDSAAASAAAAAPSGGGGRRRGGRRSRGAPSAEAAADPNRLDISASLFSVRRRRSVALIQMRYSGASIEDAMSKFTAKLKESVPDMSCVGWNWSVNIDPEAPSPEGSRRPSPEDRRVSQSAGSRTREAQSASRRVSGSSGAERRALMAPCRASKVRSSSS